MNTTLFLAAQAASGNAGYSTIIMMVVIFVIAWFFMIRPQQKRQKEIKNFQNSLTEGSKVITGGGVYGIVKKIDLTANTVEIEISRGVLITVNKAYVFKDVADSSTQSNNKTQQ